MWLLGVYEWANPLQNGGERCSFACAARCSCKSHVLVNVLLHPHSSIGTGLGDEACPRSYYIYSSKIGVIF